MSRIVASRSSFVIVVVAMLFVTIGGLVLFRDEWKITNYCEGYAMAKEPDNRDKDIRDLMTSIKSSIEKAPALNEGFDHLVRKIGEIQNQQNQMQNQQNRFWKRQLKKLLNR